jgi:hypothetical protein
LLTMSRTATCEVAVFVSDMFQYSLFAR